MELSSYNPTTPISDSITSKMSSIEDKILDGPRVHYCDADNDDTRTDFEERVDRDDPEPSSTRNDCSSLFVRPDEETEKLSRVRQKIPTCSTNTGPKGVIEDHRKQSSTKRNQHSNDDDDLEAEFQNLLNDDSILKEYISKRIAQEKNKDISSFGQVYRLQTGTELLDAIDKEKPNVLVVVHIYTKYSRSCANIDRCLDELAAEVKHVKFVTLDASVAGLSENFKENGVPALLAYRGGNLIKSLVQLEELLDKDFNVAQIRELMVDNGVLDFSN